MEALADSATERILFYGIRIPTPALRQMPVLPTPKGDLSPPSGFGVRAVTYLPELGWIRPDWIR
jgi:hypothetical protein